METKYPWQSRTILMNGIVGLVAFLSLFWSGAHVITDYLTSHSAQAVVIWSVLNMALRLVTKDKIVLTD